VGKSETADEAGPGDQQDLECDAGLLVGLTGDLVMRSRRAMLGAFLPARVERRRVPVKKRSSVRRA
jgi:hypothetical protein